jgi:hypothetical protein
MKEGELVETIIGGVRIKKIIDDKIWVQFNELVVCWLIEDFQGLMK